MIGRLAGMEIGSNVRASKTLAGIRTLFFVNDGPYMFAFKSLGNISFLHTIDDLNLADHFAILEDLQGRGVL